MAAARDNMNRESIRGLLFEPSPEGKPSGWIFNRYPQLALRVIIAAVFLYAGLQKINNPLIFADQIKMYEVIGDSPLLYVMAVFLPWLEIVCGISLLTGIFIRGGSLIFSVLMAGFLGVVVYRTTGIMDAAAIPFTEVYFDCGCGFEPTYAWKKIIENTALLIFSLLILFSPCQRFVLIRSGRGDPV
ncbi:MAG: DoxX family protein [Candidatus Krumholzibacteriales bacterium]